MISPIHAAEPEQRFESYAEFYRKSAYAEFQQEHRVGGSFGLTMMRVEQEPIDFIDSPVPDLVFCRGDTPVREILLDCGDGPTSKVHLGGEFTVYPAFSSPRTRVLDPHRITAINMPASTLHGLTQSAGISDVYSSLGPFIGRTFRHTSASRLMDRIWRVLQSPTPTDHLLLDGLTLQFLAEMAGARDLAPLGGARPNDQRIARVIDYIEANLGEQFDIGALAAIACLSPPHFSRVFKATVGEPAWAYVQQRRCVRAKELLAGSRLALVEIAYRCGFSSQAHFTRSLKAHFGVTPGQIRAASK